MSDPIKRAGDNARDYINELEDLAKAWERKYEALAQRFDSVTGAARSVIEAWDEHEAGMIDGELIEALRAACDDE